MKGIPRTPQWSQTRPNPQPHLSLESPEGAPQSPDHTGTDTDTTVLPTPPKAAATSSEEVFAAGGEFKDPEESEESKGLVESEEWEKSEGTVEPERSEESEESESTMSARSRTGRSGPAKDGEIDNEEEQEMWRGIQNSLRKVKVVNDLAKANVVKTEEFKKTMSKPPSSAELAELQKLYADGVKWSEQERQILHEEPHDLLKNVEILKALTEHSAHESTQRNPLSIPKISRTQKKQNPKLETDGTVDSPIPSPAPSSATKLKGNLSRSGSIPTIKETKELKEAKEAKEVREAKEASVKIEEGSEGLKGPSAERAGKFVVGAEVAYKQTKVKEEDGQWIQCSIISITDIGGNKKRYEVQDPEPDETGAPGQIYKTTAVALIAIPSIDQALPDYPVGKQVLARYPETTTFYRAQVTAMKKGICRLKFEEDADQQLDVDRRFVLDVAGK